MYRGAMSGIKRHHEKTYGSVENFGYKDFIPDFTGENFNAEEWVKLFKDAGARFAGPVAEHHDGFSMWDSKVNRWNAAKMGPKRDILGEFEKAIRKHGLKFVTTFHHSHNWYYYNHSPKYDTGDPEYADLYGPAHSAGRKYDSPNKEFLETWLAKLKEVIDNYRPDLIWFDFGLERIHDKYKREFAAYYYNKAEEWGEDVEIIYKGHHLPPGVGLTDYERGRNDKLTYYKWMTDTTIGTKSWSYIEDEVYKPLSMLIHNLVDRIAKHGYLMLNFGPKANGDIPQEVVSQFKEMGKWIEINKEAIFNTTPWVIAEEGPTKMTKTGAFSEGEEVSYSAEDLRFVTKDNSLYVFSLGWPGEELLIKSLIKPPLSKSKASSREAFQFIDDSDIKSIQLLGHDQELKWTLSTLGLKIELPASKPCEHAYAFKITWI
jgi:alpha-L-fucosidase